MKDRIMKAFIEEVQLKGMRLTVDDLAKRLRISKKTLYIHFSSKVEILEAIIEQSFQEMDKETEEILQNSNLNLIEKIKGVITVLPKHYEFYDLRILEQMKQHYPEQWAKVDASLKDDWDILKQLIERGIQEGVILKTNVNLLMKLIIDATNSTLDQRFYMQNNLSVSEALESIVNILFYGFIIEDR